MEIELEGELLDYFNQFTDWVSKNRKIKKSHLAKVKDRAIVELHNDSNKWYHEKDFADLYDYCFFKTA
jgi:hypothetical protein